MKKLELLGLNFQADTFRLKSKGFEFRIEALKLN